MAIQNINAGDIQRITSGQVIIDLVSIVKELVENSIDASSSKIEVLFKNSGLDSIEIIDDGIGIGEDDFTSVCLKHCTSKLSTFEQLSEVNTLGFRGEALSSLCSVSNLRITTCTKENYPRATELKYNAMGVLTNKKKVIGGIKGTSILVSSLFHNLPVRQKNLQKNLKREYNKAVSLLINYIIINPSIRFTVYNINPKTSKKNLIIGTKGTCSSTILDNVVNIFGSNGAYGLIPIDLSVDDIDVKFKLNRGDFPTHKKLNVRFKGYISNSSFGLGRSSGDRQYLFINGRPIIFKKFLKTINEVYKSFNHVQFPVVILNVIIDTEFLDINVTPDKRVIMIQNEDLINDILRNEVTKFFDTQNTVIPKNKSSGISLSDEKSSVSSNSVHETKVTAVVSNVNETSRETEVQKNLMVTRKREHHENKTDEEAGEKEVQEENDEEEEEEEKVEVDVEDVQEDIDEEEEGGEEEAEEAEEDQEDEEEEENEKEIMDLDEEADEINDDSKISRNKSIDSHLLVTKGTRTLDIGNNDKTQRARDKLLSDMGVVEVGLTSTNNRRNRNNDIENEQSSDNEDVLQILNERGVEKQHNNSLEFNDSNIHESTRISSKRNRDEQLFVSESDDEPKNDNKVLDLSSFKNSASEPKKLLKQIQPDVTDNLRISIGDREVEERPIKRTKTMISRDEITFNEDPAVITKHASKSYVHNLSTTLDVDLQHIYSELEKHQAPGKSQDDSSRNIAIDNIESTKEAEEKLSYTILKSDFLEMKLIGQFNLGFILVTLNSSNNLFIIDQHASDEKYNFEKLTEITTFQNQTLVIPKTIELNAIDEMIVMDNLSVFKQNGFVIQVEEDNPPGKRIKLISLPVLKNVLFDISDFHELIHLINTHNSTSNEGIKCSKIRSLLAMRACRSSIMIGQHLNRKTMTKILTNLSKLDKPWNCPHGRPTMRHLTELQKWSSFKDDYQL